MFGDISAWFVEYVAGIRPGAPGYKQVIIKPDLMNGLGWAQATHESPYGTISSAWQLNGQAATLNVTIPPNTTGKIYLPRLGRALTNLVIQESGATIWQSGAATGSVAGVTFDRVDASQEFLIWNVEAGAYQFAWQVTIQVPGNLTAIADNQQVKLTWNPVVGADGYNLKSAATAGGPFVPLTNTIASLSYTDRAVTNRLTYYYVVSAVMTNGESADSEPVSATPALDLNLGFEKVRISDYQYNPAGAAWTFSGSSGDGSGLIANGSGFSNPDAPEGTQAAFVQGFGTLSQVFAGFSPGITYSITFSAAQRPGVNQHGGQSWDVKIDTNIVANYNPGPGATAYVDYTVSFAATATNHTLTFVGTDLPGGDNTVFIDNVRFSPPISATNIPLVIQGLGQAGINLFLTGTGPPSTSMVLMTATNLCSPIAWQPLATNLSAASGQFAFSNLFATNPQQFYRVSAK
jgi:hypothetical protein